MGRKLLWAMVGCATATIMLLAACARPATAGSPTQATRATTTTTPTAAPTTTSSANKPQYGGTLTIVSTSDPLGFDPAYSFSVNDWPALFGFTNNELMTGNWALGPAGTDQTDWTAGFLGQVSLETGSLATSWDMPDDSTIVFHIRQGVHFWNKAPVNGRELTANDVVWSENREWTSPKSFLNITNLPSQRPISFSAPDKWTVVVKVPPAVQGSLLFLIGDQCHIYAPEVPNYSDWHNAQGTGPFMLTDYVPDSEMTYKRNPDYWQTDPCGPGKGNQLPYIDGINQLIITDKSTFVSAFRTAKVDITAAGAPSQVLNWDDVGPLLKENSNLQEKVTAGGAIILYGRLDKPDLPFQDIRVREALNMAVDKQAIINGYYSGKATMLGAIIPDAPPYTAMYTPLDQLPQAAQELFTYNPDQAKQLLTQAGYPNGFETNIVCASSTAADFLSIVAADWAKVGVKLDIKEVDPGVFGSIIRGRNYDQMIMGGNTMSAFPWKMSNYRKEMSDDVSYFEDPKTRAAYNDMQPYIGKDDAKWEAIVKQIIPYCYSQAVGVYMPEAYGYVLWWPWLKNYAGEGSIGYDNQVAWAIYAWIDQPMKKSMGY